MRGNGLIHRLRQFINGTENGEGLENYGYGKVYRASMWSETQKFLDIGKAKDLLVDNEPEMRAKEREKIAEEAGFTLSKAEDRAYNAVQKLLNSGKARQDGRDTPTIFTTNTTI